MGLVDLGRRRLGWQEDAALVASVRLERNGDEIQIRSIDHDAVAHARALLEAVAGIVEASRLTGSDAVLGDCGFSHDGRRWVRDVVAAPAPESAVSAVTLGELEAAIRSAWGSDTTDEPGLWSRENPALGQCAVTALVVRDHLGGEIVVAGVVRDGRRVGRHAWNRLPSGLAVDVTREQFRAGETFEEPHVPDFLLTERHPERYALLAERVEAKLRPR